MAGASGTIESCKSFLTTVDKCVECPVCLGTAKVPFTMCSRGHIVCVSCTTKISKCPTCEGQFTQVNPVCVKTILEALLRRCIYSEDGCEEIVKPGNDHEEFCGYRPFVCKERGCSVKMPVMEVLDHYKEYHLHENNNLIIMRYRDGIQFPNNPNVCSFTPVWLFDNLFWIVFVPIPNLLHRTFSYNVFFLATPIGKLNHDYYVRVTIQNRDFLVTNTLKVIAENSSFENMECTYDGTQEMKTLVCMKSSQGQIINLESKTNKIGEIKLVFSKMAKE